MRESSKCWMTTRTNCAGELVPHNRTEPQPVGSNSEIRDLQNNEIRTAETVFREGAAERWPIPELS